MHLEAEILNKIKIRKVEIFGALENRSTPSHSAKDITFREIGVGSR